MHKHSIIGVILVSLPLVSLTGCAWQNRTRITHLAELEGKLYIATEDGGFKTYDIEKDTFRAITALRGSNVIKIIPAKQYLILETRSVDANTYETHRNIYLITPQGEITSMNIEPDGSAQEGSALVSADDKYIYGVRNDLNLTANRTFLYSLRTFRYDKKTKGRVDNHFDADINLVVRDIYEDENYYWYACYRNPSALGWTMVRGNLAVVRRDKATNEQRTIALGDGVFQSGIHITGDRNSVWVSGETEYGTNVFRISQKDSTYEAHSIRGLTSLVRGQSSGNDESYLWILMSGGFHLPGDVPAGLRRYDKTSLKGTQVTEYDDRINRGIQAVADAKYVWMGLLEHNPWPGSSAWNHSPYLLRVSKDDLSTKVIPIETTFAEGISNVMRSFVQDIYIVASVIFWAFR